MTTNEEIKQRIKLKVQTKNSLDNAVLHTQRCRLYCQGLPDSWWRNEIAYLNEYLKTSNQKDTIRSRYTSGAYVVLQKAFEKLPLDKFHKFLSNFNVPTQPIISKAKSEIERIFYALGANEHYGFIKDEYFADWQNYRKEVADGCSDKYFWQNEGLNALFCEPNSLILIHIPTPEETAEEIAEEQNENEYSAFEPKIMLLPEPEYKLIKIEEIYNISCDSKEIEWVILHTEDGYKYIDEYVMADIDKEQKITAIYEHNFDKIPCNWLISKNRYSFDYIQKEGLISPVIDRLDNFTMDYANAVYMYDSNAYPITYKYAEDCTYKTTKENFSCNGGTCSYTYMQDGITVPYVGKCFCSESKLVGAGSLIEVKAPIDGAIPDMFPPVGQLQVDVNALTFVRNKLVEDENMILGLIIGGNIQSTEEQAKNEIQVQGNFESRNGVLMSVSEMVQYAWNYANNFCAVVRYGNDFKEGNKQLGTEFFLIDLATLQEQYVMAVERGDIAEMQNVQNQITLYKQRNNNKNLVRAKIIKALNPYSYYSLPMLQTLQKDGVISREELRYILQLPNLIDTFEQRINFDIVTFGETLPFEVKIKKIKDFLKQIFTEYEQENKADEPAGVQQQGVIGRP